MNQMAQSLLQALFDDAAAVQFVSSHHVPGTVKMSRNQNDDAPANKSLKTSNDTGFRDWSKLPEDLRLPIIWKLGPTDLFGVRGICNPWRSTALSHMNKFLGSRRPMKMSYSNRTFYFEDFEGRKSKIPLPRFTGRACVGVTCGYMIMFGLEARDFLLVNPFKMHEIHVPACPFIPKVNTNASQFRGILVFSPSTSQPVFVFAHKFTDTVYSHVSGDQWYRFNVHFPILDIHAFKGKIYAISDTSRLFEVGLHPNCSLTQLEIQNYPARHHLLRPEFVTSGKNLYVVDCFSADKYEAYKLDFERRECMQIDKTVVEYAFFVGDWKTSAAVDPDTWADSQMPDGKGGYLKDATDRSKLKGMCLIANMWYFPHDFSTVDILQLQ